MALWRFLLFAFKPIPRAADWIRALLTGALLVAGTAASGFLFQSAAVAVVVLVSGIGLLLLVAGVRLERSIAAAEEVAIDFDQMPTYALAPHVAQLSVRITNRGPRSRFEASIVSDVVGINHPKYGHFLVAWEQATSESKELGRGETGHIRLAKVYTRNGSIRFVVPPSGDNPNVFGEGLENQISAETIAFTLGVRDLERDVLRDRRVTISFPGESLYPELALDGGPN